MQFKHRFRVHAPLEEVFEFHRHAAGLKALTPPLAFMRFHQVPDPIQEGDVLSFSMWLGPIPVRWESQFPEFTETGFVDTQGKGPFQSWEHQHSFVAIDQHTTEIVDQIEVMLRPHLWHGFVGLTIWMSLPMLFWYRKVQTRKLLEKGTG
jgi:ligand-binding SRPBCC domain-containing protein